jgi:hypothetical protein
LLARTLVLEPCRTVRWQRSKYTMGSCWLMVVRSLAQAAD